MLLWSTIIATLVGLASAAVFPRDSGFKTLTPDKISSTDPFAHYSAAVKCNPQSLSYWNCGLHCQATPNFELYTIGGNGQDIQYFFVGYDNAADSIIVSRQGNIKKIFSNLNDASSLLTNLDPTIFPNITNAILVHQMVVQEQAKSAADMLQAVGNLMQTYPASRVTIVGHSFGAGLALLDGVLLRMLLPPNTDVRVVAYGLPRIGNDVFANFVDGVLPGRVKHIANMRDPVPTVPAISLGYHQSSGEIHIQQSGQWIECPYQDNGDSRCIAGTVSSINNANFNDHYGPYDGVMLNCNS